MAARPSKKHYIQQKNAAPENSIEIIHFLFESCQEQQSSMYRQDTICILRRSTIEKQVKPSFTNYQRQRYKNLKFRIFWKFHFYNKDGIFLQKMGFLTKKWQFFFPKMGTEKN